MPYGEDLNYWKTSKSYPDKWLASAKREIEKINGVILAEGYGSEPVSGRAAYMLGFELQGERFRVVWPVLPSKGGDELAARRQAATMLYHHVKQACIDAQVLGARAAFFSHLLLPDGRRAADVADPDLSNMLPRLLAG